MKRSQKISLLVLGAAAMLSGCSPDEQADVMQQTYASREDCVRDWGDQTVCTTVGVNSTGYIGPRYYWSRSAGYPVALMSDGSERVMSSSFISHGGVSVARSTVTVARSVSVGGGAHGFGGVSHGGFGASAHAGSAGG